MTLNERISAFIKLGDYLKNLSSTEQESLAEQARLENPWFTEDNVKLSLKGLSQFLSEDELINWIAEYTFKEKKSKIISVVMAGNIPLVGFHDLLCVLISGHSVQIKMSSKDSYLMKQLIQKLISINPAFSEKIQVVERLNNFDAVIATGSDNSARYFEYYFGKYPNIIRKNRTSCAILDGSENPYELTELGKDVFSYFGLGCRNVSKLFVPKGYTFNKLFESWEGYRDIIHHHKYCNNYDYQKSIMLVNNVHFLDNGFILVTENERLVSPISVLYYEFYENGNQLQKRIKECEGKIQCIVGKEFTSFGQAQLPKISDYADAIDTMKFLLSL